MSQDQAQARAQGAQHQRHRVADVGVHLPVDVDLLNGPTKQEGDEPALHSDGGGDHEEDVGMPAESHGQGDQTQQNPLDHGDLDGLVHAARGH